MTPLAVARSVVAAAIVAGIAPGARADALVGKAQAFKAHARNLFHFDDEAMVARQCGLRSEAWRGQVGRGVQHRIDNMAAVTLPSTTDAAGRTALMEVARDLEAELGVTIQSITTNDCQTLRGSPAEMQRLDALAVEGSR